MDSTKNEEAIPLPLPVGKKYNNAYLNAEFINREIGNKA